MWEGVGLILSREGAKARRIRGIISKGHPFQKSNGKLRKLTLNPYIFRPCAM
jgi:hypothetical protein